VADEFTLLGDADKLVGNLANYFQFLGVPGIIPLVTGLLQSNDKPSEQLQILQSLSSRIDDLINLAGATEAEVKMASLLNFAVPVTADEEVVLREGGLGAHVDKARFFDEALTLLDACANDFYWYRPLVLARAFTSANMNGWIGYAWYGPFTSPDPPFRLLPPQDTARIEGFSSVFDPQLALPAFVSAIKSFLCIAYSLDPAGFPKLLDPSAPGNYNDKLRQIADELQSFLNGRPNSRSDTLIGGLVSTEIPTPKAVRDWLTVVVSEGSVLGKPGFEWNGLFGVMDLYGVYPAPVKAPENEGSHRIDIYPTGASPQEFGAVLDGIPLDDQHFQDFIYPWIQDRLTVGLLARKKALYIGRGYDKAWSVLQHLRVLCGDQTTEKPDQDRDWSLRNLFAQLPTFPAVDTATKGFPLSFLIERLRQIGGTPGVSIWQSIPRQKTPDRYDFTENGLPWSSAFRPVGLRQVLNVATAM
jgi:hypothetical protein